MGTYLSLFLSNGTDFLVVQPGSKFLEIRLKKCVGPMKYEKQL